MMWPKINITRKIIFSSDIALVTMIYEITVIGYIMIDQAIS